ncbi:carbon-nitrogen hydrolase family protein [Blastomonas sp.]|uniref:carbon-nitrogen hydrolase family protein n=1 Tax=Blastomonas sp. TaxID=1909299 RepID=UPI0035944187
MARQTTVRAAIVQAAPLPLAIGEGIAALTAHITAALDHGAQIVAFGESFLGGYPLWLDEAPGAALWDHPGNRALHAILLDEALVVGDDRLGPVQDLVDRSGALVSVGAHERVRSSLYNCQLLFRPGLPPLIHRKLVPTHGERLIWARGDGSTLKTHASEAFGPVGSLICWEHWMPLARAAMHNQGESVHVAAWPTVRETYAIASRHYAFEGRCFVLAAGTIQHRADVLAGLDRCRVGSSSRQAARELIEAMPDGQLQFGGSMIIAPDASLLAQAGDEAALLVADLDLAQIGGALAALDSDGHYARPDVFELRIDTRPKNGVVWGDRD